MSGFTIERTYPHPPERVWRALTTPALMERWLMPTDFAPEVGRAFTFRTDPGPGFDGVVHCSVLALDAPRSMRWSWRGGPVDTEVAFALAPVDGGAGTRLTVTQTGFRGVKAAIVGRILKVGSRTIYGRRLPRVLDALALAGDVPEAVEDAACMSRRQRAWRGLLGLLERRARP